MANNKFAFYLDNTNISNRAIQDLDKGNPGIGGTEYIFYLTVCYLNKYNPDNQVVLYLAEEQIIPADIDYYVVGNIIDAINVSKSEGVEVLVFRNNQSESVYKYLNEVGLKCVVWAHNYNYTELSWIDTCDSVKLYVCVSRAQMIELSYLNAYRKMTYSYIGIHMNLIRDFSRHRRGRKVVFQGALTKQKGFHVVAKMWPYIKGKVPDAELHVIGSGKLYGDMAIMGKYGLADQEYEKVFMPYLTDEKGNISESVHFHGIVSSDLKMKIISEAKVGILNPTGLSECCPMSGVEIQALGIPLVTTKKLGCKDVVQNKISGFATYSYKKMRKYLIDLLLNNELNEKLGYQGYKFVESRFSLNQYIIEWDKTLCMIANHINVPVKHNIGFINNLNRIRKKTCIHKLARKILNSYLKN